MRCFGSPTFPTRRPRWPIGRRRLSPPDPAFQLFEGLFPGMHGLGAEARLDRRVAALRVVEAIRMHAATHGGSLPESLDKITEVPVPFDPVTGQPFGYHLEGGRAKFPVRAGAWRRSTGSRTGSPSSSKKNPSVDLCISFRQIPTVRR